MRTMLAGCPRGRAFASASSIGLVVACLASPSQAGEGKHYGIAVSGAQTQNVSFSNGVFQSTGDHAILNVNDLENALAGGNVEVTTGVGKGGETPGNINIEATLTWAGAFALTLNAYHSIYIDQPVTDAGTGALTLMSNIGGNTGGDLYFSATGNIGIWDLSDVLIINSHVYTLVGDVASIGWQQSGYVALANDYNAGNDKFTRTPINEVAGQIEGLGHTLSNVTVTPNASGLIGGIDSGAAVRDLHLTNVDIVGIHHPAGGLAGANEGLVQGVTVAGKVTAINTALGGLLGISVGSVIDSSAAVTLTSEKADAGGLVGQLYQGGSISNSSATGSTTVQHAGQGVGSAGGLVGFNDGGAITGSFASGPVGGSGIPIGGLVGNQSSATSSVMNSYATGVVTGGNNAKAGGLIGQQNVGQTVRVSDSYSTGAVTAGKTTPGGVLGRDAYPGGCDCFTDSYWDTTTSGITNPAQGAGNVANDPGIAGLTTTQLQAGLPAGFDPTIWAENPSINGGLPYLIANPPPQ